MLQGLRLWKRASRQGENLKLQKEMETLLGCSDCKEEATQEDIRLLMRAVSVKLQPVDLLELVSPFHSALRTAGSVPKAHQTPRRLLTSLI